MRASAAEVDLPPQVERAIEADNRRGWPGCFIGWLPTDLSTLQRSGVLSSSAYPLKKQEEREDA